MGMSNRHVYLLFIIAMCGRGKAFTSTIDGDTFSSPAIPTCKPQVQEARYTRASCQCDMDDRSVLCEGKQLRTVPSYFSVQCTRKLYLQRNDIRVLLNTSFEPYPNLITLDISMNNLRIIESAAFQPLKHLQSLCLSDNRNLEIPNSIPFRPLTSLVLLRLNLCYLEEMPNDLMDWFPNLKYLDLSDNHLTTVNVSRCKTERMKQVLLGANRFQDLTPDKFIFACPTEMFSLLANPIRYISEDSIAALSVHRIMLGFRMDITASMFLNITSGVARSSIIIFIISHINEGIPIGVFRPLHAHPLEILGIVDSGDIPLYPGVFSGLSCMKLMFYKNFINVIEPEYFLGISGMQVLGLTGNEIKRVNPHNTTWESNIVQLLELSRNKLIEIYGYQFRGLSNLKKLNLSGNEDLLVLDLLSYDGFDSLEGLDVTGTRIEHIGLSSGLSYFSFADHIPGEFDPFIPGQMFNSTTKLEYFVVSNSKLNRGNIWDPYDSISLFQGLIKLKLLHLSNNPLGNLPDRVFKDNTMLVQLMMDNCKIHAITAEVFHGLKSLFYLDLSGNNLLILSANALMYFRALELLKIDANKIMFVEEGAVERVPFLKLLSLSSNRLVAFNRSTWNNLMKLEYIDVSGNPFACQCSYAWLRDIANTSEKFLHRNETLCSDDSLSHLRGKPLLEFDPSNDCVPNIVLISTLPFVGLALLIGLLLAIHNRWLIRYKLFLVKLAIIGYREMQDAREHEEFVFDLNIMFTEQDEEWAREHLRPTLQERLPDFDRYSFGDDDLTIGMYYLDAVHYAVEHSFKTILLLSRRAVRDNWFLIKFRTAMDHVNDGLTENTVVIFLEDIPEDEIPYLIRLYLSDRRPYMRWPEDIRGREYFWNELTKVVPFNLKYNPLIPPE